MSLAGFHADLLGRLSPWEWILVGAAVVAAVWVVLLAVRMTLRPGEDGPDHPKRMILDDPADRQVDRPTERPAAPRGSPR